MSDETSALATSAVARPWYARNVDSERSRTSSRPISSEAVQKSRNDNTRRRLHDMATHVLWVTDLAPLAGLHLFHSREQTLQRLTAPYNNNI